MKGSSILQSRYPNDPKVPLPSGWSKHISRPYAEGDESSNSSSPYHLSLTEIDEYLQSEELNSVTDASNEGLMKAMRKKIAYLEKSLGFMQVQHKDILSALQKEIDKLKNENQHLQFQLVMLQGDDGTVTHESSSERKPSGNAVLRAHVEDLKQEVGRLKQRNVYLEDLVKKQETILKVEKEKHNDVSSSDSSSVFLSVHSNIIQNITLGHMKVLLEPLMIMELNGHTNEAITTKEPTLKECEAIIKYMVMKNQALKEENECLMEERNKRLSSRGSKDSIIKPTTAADSTGDRKYSARTIPQLPPIHPSVTVPLSLPVLKQSLGNNIADRQRRTRSLQKNRLKMTEHSLYRYE